MVALVCQRDASTTYARDAAIKCAHVCAHEHMHIHYVCIHIFARARALAICIPLPILKCERDKQLMGMCESMWKPGLEVEELFETISQCLLAGADRCYAYAPFF